jgi:hypothetical protein
MAQAIPNPDVAPNGDGGEQLLPEAAENQGLRNGKSSAAAAHGNLWGSNHSHGSDPESWAGEDPELLKTLGINPRGPGGVESISDVEQFRHENTELRSIIAELHGQLETARKQAEQGVQDRLKEYDSLLEEKSELIRTLHEKIQELEARPVVPQTPKEEELLALSEELDRERCQLHQERRQLEEDRQQLVDDEELMTKQMRDMEVQMARERADFARQRIELNRIYEEVRREMENIERNGLLNQRLGQLRNRLQDVPSSPKGSSPCLPPACAPAPSPPDDASQPATAIGEPFPKRRETFLGRLFG